MENKNIFTISSVWLVVPELCPLFKDIMETWQQDIPKDVWARTLKLGILIEIDD